MHRILVLLNARAGALIDSGTERLRDEAFTALAPRGERLAIHLLEPRQMPRAIAAAVNSEHDTVIVGGGDGTASLAVRALAGTDKRLGIVPCGTLNLLARDLGMPADLHAAIAALRDAEPRSIDLASLNGRPFHTLSGIGFFSQMARAREEVRGHPLGRFLGVGLAAIRALRRTGSFALEISADETRAEVDALAVLVTNNRFSPDWRRARLDEGVIELHIAENAGALSMLKATADLMSGQWRESAGIRSLTARRVTIGHVRRRTWAATDGELARERVPLEYAAMPGTLKVLALDGETGAA